jgi:hypothetical protein
VGSSSKDQLPKWGLHFKGQVKWAVQVKSDYQEFAFLASD